MESKKAIAKKANGKLVDLSYQESAEEKVEYILPSSEEGIEVIRHSSAHLMAHALKRVYGEVKFGVGPVIKDGFYYDFLAGENVSSEDFEKIEEEMKKIVKENLPIVREEVSREEAKRIFESLNDELKVEILSSIPEGEIVSLYRQGEFVDLCRGPHVPSTGYLQHVKLMSLSGAYFRGDSEREMLQRIYGTVFPSKEKLKEHLVFLEEARKRDHKKLGAELELFMLLKEAPGMPFFLDKGLIIKNELEKFWREVHRKAGYLEVKTPILMTQKLWETSGHMDHYSENMFFTESDGEKLALKPMSCPGAVLVFNSKLRSYRELPLRFGELGHVHRKEKSGALNGLLRVQAFTQDDAHIFARMEQIESEINEIIKIIDEMYSYFSFSGKVKVELSTRPESSMGTDEQWNSAIEALENVLRSRGIDYEVNEGDGAFYGPKIDFHVSDAIGRTWQCATIQLDFQMPEKFGCKYVGEDGKYHIPVVIHRVVFGSVERFIGILIEHFEGKFPLWLSPLQVKIVPVSEVHFHDAKHLQEKLIEEGIRAEVDLRDEKMKAKIRDASLQKATYICVVGDKEVEDNTLSVRKGSQSEGVEKVEDFIEKIQKLIKEKA